MAAAPPNQRRSARRDERAPHRDRIRRSERLLSAAVLAATLALSYGSLGCAVLRRPLVLPPKETPYVAVISGEMRDPIANLGRHSWIIANPAGEGRRGQPLFRYELLSRAEKSTTTEPFHYFGHGDVALHALISGDQKEVDAIVACLDKETPIYNKEHPDYFMIPGPNSNTYVDQMLRRCDMHVDLPATAVGKDFRGIAGITRTSGGTGFQIETIVGGVRLGLKEGVEIHILGIAIGVDLWPPALIVPINPGRLGFDDR